MTKQGKFLQKINEAFAKNDIDFIIEKTSPMISGPPAGGLATAWFRERVKGRMN